MKLSTTPPQHSKSMVREQVVYRNLALPVSVFDHIKNTQRSQQASQGRHLSINEVVSHIVREHQQQLAAVESEERKYARHSKTPTSTLFR